MIHSDKQQNMHDMIIL